MNYALLMLLLTSLTIYYRCDGAFMLAPLTIHVLVAEGDPSRPVSDAAVTLETPYGVMRGVTNEAGVVSFTVFAWFQPSLEFKVKAEKDGRTATGSFTIHPSPLLAVSYALSTIPVALYLALPRLLKSRRRVR